MKPKKLKMNLRIVADDVHGIKAALRHLSKVKENLLSNECAEMPNGITYDYDFVRSDCVFSKDGKKKCVTPNIQKEPTTHD